MTSDETGSGGPPTLPWPAVIYEKVPWVSRLDQVTASRRQQKLRTGPYRAAVVPVIAAAPVPLGSGLAALVEDASAEIARFDAELGSEIAPFSSILLRTESVASSRIENLTASARAIAEAELVPSSRGNAAEIVANTTAMKAALDLAGDISASSILAMHEALLGAVAPAIAGRWRDQQVWVGGGDHGPHLAEFVPPQQSRVQSAIDDLIDFVARDDIPVLAHVAIAHAQFETIHPFPNGNGRTGRALVQAMLAGKRLTRNVTVPVSAGLRADTGAYFDALTSYRAGQISPIVTQFAQATFRALTNGRRLVDDLRGIRRSWDDVISARSDSAVWRLAELLIRRPVLNAQTIAQELAIDSRNVTRYIHPLIDVGVLVESHHRRNQIWRSPEVLSALDAFAARAGRRIPAP
jgi:Fic family protein